MKRIVLLSGVATLAMLGLTAPGSANEQLIELEKKPENWVMQLGNYAGHRYSQLDQINRDNVKDLRVAWTFSTGVLRGHEGGPLVIGDVMYVHTPFPNKVYALDLKEPGRQIWDYEPQQDPSVIPVMCCDTVNRGVAYMPGDPAKIFISLADTTLVALNAETGEELWSHNNGIGHNGGIISYEADGKQYVAVATGWGSLVGDEFPKLFGEPYTNMPKDTGALVVFALPESQ